MRVDIRIEGDAGDDELRSLYRWLSADSQVRRHGNIDLAAPPPQSGHMGELLDVLSLTLSSGFSAASLAVAISTWRRTNPIAPSVTVERPDGSVITLSSSSPEDEARLREFLDEQE
ncbi:hypothetical protein E0L36_22555 [Streptomyces sp. AJS327]|uniref:effector-associated constant component EACC1 n=1 Tax=Streptomyces sp. AJS327 TaxID=2545265 RepID=UPI0015DF4FD4|nr:hypothetical protein [Streptomyces sp. AJS327]MBA0053556.1 hypothetical protein [Streptomyces sp. AJS327]